MAVSPELQELIEQSAVTLPESEGDVRQAELRRIFPCFDMDAVLSRPPMEFLVQDLIPKGSTGIWHSPPKAGKSAAFLDLFAAMVKGAMFADRFYIPEPVNVAYCLGEGWAGHPNRMRSLHHKWQFTPEEKQRLITVPVAPNLYTDSALNHVSAFIERLLSDDDYRRFLEGGFLVIDTLARASVGANENETKDSVIMMDTFTDACRRLECSGALAHHDNRQKEMRGNSNFAGAVDYILKLVPVAGSMPQRGSFEFDFGKDTGPFVPLGYELPVHEWMGEDGREHKGVYVNWTGPVDPDEQAGSSAADTIAKIAHHFTHKAVSIDNAATRNQVADAVGVAPNTVKKHLPAIRAKFGDRFQSVNLKTSGGVTEHYYLSPENQESVI